MTDRWADASGGVTGAITGAVAVTPHDSTNLAAISRALYVGAAGNVSVVLADGVAVTLVGLAAGVWHPMRVRRVNATLTTATGIVVGY